MGCGVWGCGRGAGGQPLTARLRALRSREYNSRVNPLDPSTPTRTVDSTGGLVRLFDAMTTSGERVILKEFTEQTKSEGLDLAEQELRISQRLAGAWDVKLRDGAVEPDPPITPVIGTLRADETFSNPRFVERWVSKFPNVAVPRPGNTWLVFRW